MKKMGRTHRPYFRLCAVDQRSPRDGRVIEELGQYDPMCPETDARAILKGERIDYWIGVGAQPSDKAQVLIKKYGSNGTHLEQQKAALERLGKRKEYTWTPAPAAPPKPTEEAPAAEATESSEPAEGASGAEEAAAEATSESSEE